MPMFVFRLKIEQTNCAGCGLRFAAINALAMLKRYTTIITDANEAIHHSKHCGFFKFNMDVPIQLFNDRSQYILQIYPKEDSQLVSE